MSSGQSFQVPPRFKSNNSQASFLKEMLLFLEECAENYPDITHIKLLNRYIYVVQNPQMAKYVLQENHTNYAKGRAYDVLRFFLGNGLLTSEGDFWKRQRRLAQPAFHRDRLEDLAQLTAKATFKLLREWKKREGTVINFSQEMAKLTIEIVSRALFGAEVSDDLVQKVWHSVNYLNEMAADRIRAPFIWPLWLPLPSNIRAKKHITQLDEIVFGLINSRRKNPIASNDLLNMLLNACDEESGERMTDRQLRDEVTTIFVAGHETTVNALSWTWYQLLQNPEAEQALRHEVAVLKGQAPTFEDASKLRYTNNVIHESMRLMPPVFLVGRKALRADRIGPYDLPKNGNVLVNIWGLHRHKNHWQNPLQFDPTRFDDFSLKGDNRFLYMPFGGGPRICIGNNFAMLEMQIINALLAQTVSFEAVNFPVKPLALITLKPENGVMLRLKSVTI